MKRRAFLKGALSLAGAAVVPGAVRFEARSDKRALAFAGVPIIQGQIDPSVMNVLNAGFTSPEVYLAEVNDTLREIWDRPMAVIA